MHLIIKSNVLQICAIIFQHSTLHPQNKKMLQIHSYTIKNIYINVHFQVVAKMLIKTFKFLRK